MPEYEDEKQVGLGRFEFEEFWHAWKKIAKSYFAVFIGPLELLARNTQAAFCKSIDLAAQPDFAT